MYCDRAKSLPNTKVDDPILPPLVNEHFPFRIQPSSTPLALAAWIQSEFDGKPEHMFCGGVVSRGWLEEPKLCYRASDSNCFGMPCN